MVVGGAGGGEGQNLGMGVGCAGGAAGAGCQVCFESLRVCYVRGSYCGSSPCPRPLCATVPLSVLVSISIYM
jgi:hypothetical protein